MKLSKETKKYVKIYGSLCVDSKTLSRHIKNLKGFVEDNLRDFGKDSSNYKISSHELRAAEKAYEELFRV